MSPSIQAAVTVVVTTAPDADVADALATNIVEERLAACANVVPGVTSIYRWKGEVERADELLVVFKTTPEATAALSARLTELHPYEVPEVLVLPIPDGSAPYLAWVRDEVSTR